MNEVFKTIVPSQISVGQDGVVTYRDGALARAIDSANILTGGPGYGHSNATCKNGTNSSCDNTSDCTLATNTSACANMEECDISDNTNCHNPTCEDSVTNTGDCFETPPPSC
jgi:hypothetical protein